MYFEISNIQKLYFCWNRFCVVFFIFTYYYDFPFKHLLPPPPPLFFSDSSNQLLFIRINCRQSTNISILCKLHFYLQCALVFQNRHDCLSAYTQRSVCIYILTNTFCLPPRFRHVSDIVSVCICVMVGYCI